MKVWIGTAGWSIPKQHAARFATEGSSLERYSQVLRCTEINSTFYRSHRASIYARWIASVPEDFRFSVKAPRTMTHECALAPRREEVRSFVSEIGALGTKLGVVLFQLPPKQQFDAGVAERFFALVREEYARGTVVVEPRHTSWFGAEAETVLKAFDVSRVVADPPPGGELRGPGGSGATAYFRLHGSPRIYYSSYPIEFLRALADQIRRYRERSEVWCVFDNTASGAAMGNALELADGMREI